MKEGRKAKYFPKNTTIQGLRSASVSFEDLRNQLFCKKILFFINIVLKDAWLNWSVSMFIKVKFELLKKRMLFFTCMGKGHHQYVIVKNIFRLLYFAQIDKNIINLLQKVLFFLTYFEWCCLSNWNCLNVDLTGRTLSQIWILLWRLTLVSGTYSMKNKF